MNHALLSHETETAESSRSSGSGLRVNKPGDSFEREADRIADTVTSGGYVSSKSAGWSIGSSGTIQRQTMPSAQFPNWQGGQQAIPTPNNYGDAAGSALEALLKTKEGQKILQQLESEPLISKPEGIAVSSATVGAVIGSLGVGHQPLPVQIPAISLDKLSPKLAGVSVKLTYNGPVDHPIGGMLTISYEPKSDKKEPSAEQRRAETETTRGGLQLENFQEKKQLGPVMTEGQKKEDRAFYNYSLHRVGSLPEPAVWDPRQMGKNYPQHAIDRYSPAETSTGKAPEKKSSSATTTKLPSDAPKKEEEIHVQRKALSDAAADLDSAHVEAVLRSGGRPLDHETRGYMESRIGFDFGRVTIHTDSGAASSARAVGAQAYTVGSDVVFGAGRYAPRTTEGRRLLAHELTHVVQQSAAPQRVPGGMPRVPSPAPRRVQRWPDILGGIKEKALAKLRTIPGYDLFAVILGKDPISGQPVERNATNLTHGVLELVPGGEEAFQKMKQSGAIERAYNWLTAEVDKLGFSEEYFLGLLQRAKDAIGINWEESWNQIKAVFSEPYEKLKNFASSVLHKILEFVLEAAIEALGGKEIADQILNFFRKAGNAIKTIVADPAAFLGHLLDAVKQGFSQFKDNILEHLKNGLLQWLFGEIAATGITLPKKFDISGIIGLVLQILGISYPRMRKKFVKILGEDAVNYLEGTFEIVKTILTQGIGAAWNLILQKAENLFDSVLSSVRNWVVTQIVTQAVKHLAAMFNPIGGVLESIRVIYETIKFFIDKAKQIASLLSAIVDSISEIAAGNIAKAANWIEQSMAKAIPLVLRFLAGLLGLGNVGEQIAGIIKGIQDKVDAAIDKVLDYLVEKGRQLWASAKGAATSVAEWWKAKKKFMLGEEEHTLSIEGDEDNPQVMVASNAPTTLEIFLEQVNAPKEDKAELVALAKKIKWRKKEVKGEDKAGNDGEANFNLLLEKISKLKSAGIGKIPESKLASPQRVNIYGGGVKADAFLSLDHPVGTSPERGSKPAIWEDLGPALREKKSYVRGHLLSQRLGGKGEWPNMMPITNSANQSMLNRAEKPIINAIGTGKRLIHYVVEAEYDTKIKDPASPQQAEQRLVDLCWEWNPAVYENGKWDDAKDVPKDLPEAKGKDHIDPKQ